MHYLHNIIEIWYSEFKDIMRDKGILIFIVFVPIAYPLLYSYVYTNELVREVPAAVVDDNNTPLSRKFLRNMDAAQGVSIVAHCNSMAEAKEMIKRQKVYGIIHIPDTFTKDIADGKQTYLGLYCDMSSMLYYKGLLVAINDVSLEMNKDIKVRQHLPGTTDREDEISRMPVKYEYIPLFNPQSGFASFLIPPVLMLIIQQTLFLGIGMSMGNARERNMGCIIPLDKRWYKDPACIVIGKALFYFLIYLVMAIYMFTLVTKWFGLPQLGHYGTFLCFIIPFLLACIFLAMVLSSFVYRREDCIMLFVFLSVPMLFLSGISWPGSAIAPFWKYVSYLFPSTFGMNGYVRITGCGASIYDIAFEYRGLWIQAIVYFTLAWLLYRNHIRNMVRRIKPGKH